MKNWFSYHSFVYSIGFLAQLLFSARLVVQWIKSERVKKVLSPELFWKLSLAASFLLFVYGLLRNDFAIMLGQSITYFIYIRNMQLQGSWKKYHNYIRLFILISPAFFASYLISTKHFDISQLFDKTNIPFHLLLWGSLGQVIFTLRFVYQWIYSERKKESHLPFGFWFLSLIGSLMIFSYAIFRRDPVLFLGQSFGFVIYLRNILLGMRGHIWKR